MKCRKRLVFPNSLGCVMSPVEWEDLRRRIIFKEDFQSYVFDGQLLDAFATFVPAEDMKVVRDSCKDKRCSKQFYHREAVMETVTEFTDAPQARNQLGRKSLRAALVLFKKMLPDAKLVPVNLNEIGTRVIVNKSSSAGAIAKGSKGDNLLVCLDFAHRIKAAIADLQREFSEIFVPTMPYHRSQLGSLLKEDRSYNPDFTMKDRLVEGLDGGTVFVEMQYGYPIYTLFKANFASYSGGKIPEEQRWFIRLWRQNRWWISTDFSKFDMHLPAWLLWKVFQILRDKYYDVQYHREIDWIAYNFINTVMITPDLTVVRKNKGIPSGSYFTQIVGTCANLIMNLTGMCEVSGCTSVHEMVSYVERDLYDPKSGTWRIQAMGDDCIRFSGIPITKEYVTKLADCMTKIFGVTVKPEKSGFGDSSMFPSYLKREWRMGGEYQDIRSLLINIIHNERPRDYVKYSPWHIIYGIYITYRETFNGMRMSEDEIIRRMQESKGGLTALREVNLSELPGVFRGLGESPVEMLYQRALKLAA